MLSKLAVPSCLKSLRASGHTGSFQGSIQATLKDNDSSPSVQSLHLVACTFSAYHATKHSFLKDFESHTSAPMDKYWIYFAQSLSAEAVERRLTNTLFDPSMFKQFFGIDPQT